MKCQLLAVALISALLAASLSPVEAAETVVHRNFRLAKPPDQSSSEADTVALQIADQVLGGRPDFQSAYVAMDFDLAVEATLKGLVFNAALGSAAGPITQVDVKIYQRTGPQQVGAEIHAGTYPVQAGPVTGTFPPYTLKDFIVELPSTWTLPAGSYWVGLRIPGATDVNWTTTATTAEGAIGDFGVSSPDPTGTPSSYVPYNFEHGFSLVTTDGPGGALNFTAGGLPPGLSIEALTGLISGTLSYTSAGTHQVTVTRTEGTTTASTEFQWTVAQKNAPPVITNPGSQTNAEGQTVSLQIQATDPDGDPLTYNAAGLPAGLTISSTSGLISGTITYTAAGNYSVMVGVTDGSASASALFDWTVSNTNRTPQITNPGDQSSTPGSTVTLDIQASDPDGDTLSFSATGLPPGLSISTATGRISGTISESGSGTYNVSITVSDGPNSATVNFKWTVKLANRPPEVTNPGNQTNPRGAVVSLQIEATDPDGDTLSYSATGLPPGLSINPTTGLISGTVSSTAGGQYSVTVTVSDGSLSAQVQFTWSVPTTNEPPQITKPQDQRSLPGASVSLQVLASDPNNDPLTYSASGLPPGLSIGSSTGRITGTIQSTASGSYAVTVAVSDGKLSAQVSFAWYILSYSLQFAQFGNGQLNNYAVQFYSQITFINTNVTQIAHGVLEIRDDDGKLLPMKLNGVSTSGSQQFDLSPVGTVAFKTDGEGPVVVGSVSVYSDVLISGVILMGGTVGRVGYPSSAPVRKFLAPVDLRGFGQDVETGLNIGIALVNVEKSQTTVFLQLLDDDGLVKATGQIILPAYGHLARYVNEIQWDSTPDLEAFNGSIAGFTMGSANVAVTVVGQSPGALWALPVATVP